MKFQIPNLKVGEEVQAEVREIFESGDALVSFEGDLVLIHNHTKRRFRIGDYLTLRVTAINPLAFKWQDNNGFNGLDVVI